MIARIRVALIAIIGFGAVYVAAPANAKATQRWPPGHQAHADSQADLSLRKTGKRLHAICKPGL